MALVVNDRVKETSTTTGTGTLSLAGAVTGFETFSSAIGNTNTTYYAIVNSNGEFEVGLGTVSAAALARTTVISSSNSDSAVDFSAGTKDVFCTLPASKAVVLDASGNIVANNGSNLTALNATQLTSGTVPDARFPATLPALNGSALTALNGTAISSGTVANARLPDPISDKTINASRPLTVKGDGSSADGQLILNCSQNSHGVKITSPAHSANATWEWILPVNDGTSGQVLTTDGNASAQLSWTTPTVGDVTSVVAGDGLTGGGTTGDVTLNVAAGNLIDVQADQVDVDLSELTTSTSDADGDFFAVIDAANAQKKLTKGNIAISGFNNDSGFIDGSALNASNLSSGTIPDARFPATLPAVNGSALTNLDADDLASGTVPDARFPATLPAVNGSALTNLNASNLASGTVPDARFPATLPAANGSNLTALNATNIASGTVSNARLDAQLQDIAALSATSGKVIQGDGSNFGLSAYTLPTSDGSAGNVLTTDGSGAVTFAAPTVGDITGVTAGSGLTGGGSSGSVTLDVGAGTGIDVAADAISVDVSDFMTNGSNNRVLTAAGADTMNAEANMSFDGSTLDVTGAIRATGDVTAFYSSDKNLKENISNIDSSLDKVSKINGVYYNWTKEAQEKHSHFGKEKEIGVIAQEVEEVLPEIVATREDGTKAVRYERLCALLIESVKELKKEIEELKTGA
tara:strand:- start:2625 stop:4706 length:2082 start_codon:yes stop_codon:yes gene_type:complete